ncbi:rho guanine nucleotide exchange factor 12 [Protopterus annectens]|uniref:rho guanine nucleotide exchange factor 12 n=1 Tax=Protopterus annectens TaxID=7888 RepID=UPI001CFBDDC7|nr:rho guanine nucleotide exchange factor 12 [Protopterus annectens]XP_043936951.1 rho guanine nucleotide exchange factor 12 [Protopterus annectens]
MGEGRCFDLLEEPFLKMYSPGLVQRCVIIQRDENGFGLTVSGDNPVFVQSVREDGAAMRAGVQTGDRIIKVNGTLVTHSNHVEVVKLIKSGSYVALTVLGRPPGSPQIPADSTVDPGTIGHNLSSVTMAPHFLGVDVCDRISIDVDKITSTIPVEESPLTSSTLGNNNCEKNAFSQITKSDIKEQNSTVEKLDNGDIPDMKYQHPSTAGNPPPYVGPDIIGAEDEYFDAGQYELNGQCSCFQNLEMLKCRPAHLAVFLHHVVSQFDPAPLLCYLFADMCRNTSSKETRRVFLEFHQFFLDRAANLKVPVPEVMAADLEKRRPELIQEEMYRQYIQTAQEVVMPEVQKHLEDFRQKRSMGLTLAESELIKLDSERMQDHLTSEKERSCAEQILSKIEDVLLSSLPQEEEKSITVQYVILTYMKYLGVKVKEPRNLEHKRGGRMGFLPKIKQSVKKEKEVEEKIKKRVFPNILVPTRRPSRLDSSAIGRAMEIHRRSRQSSQTSPNISESSETVKSRQSIPITDSTDSSYFSSNAVLPLTIGLTSLQEGNKQNDSGMLSTSAFIKDGPSSSESVDITSQTTGNVFEYPSSLDQLPEQDNTRNDSVNSMDVHSEEELHDTDTEVKPQNWQQLVSRKLIEMMKPHEIKRQEVINELFCTERAHVRMLKALEQVFYQPLSTRDPVLPPAELQSIFSNLEEVLQIHVGLHEQMKAVRRKYENSVIGQIGEDLLYWFGGAGKETLQQAAAVFCSNQPFALELIKSKQKKDSRFQAFLQEAESNPKCRRLQLKDIIPVEMQRLTKYPLLLENIAKYSDLTEEKMKVRKAAEHCRQILNHVNQAVKEAENKQHLEDYQRRLDFFIKPNEVPLWDEFHTLDLTKKKMIHEGPLTWKVTKDKSIDLYTLLLEDILVLLQKQDERLVLKCHYKNIAESAEEKLRFSPIIKLNTVLVRQVATDNKGFFVISMCENGALIYELVAQTVTEQKVWQDLIIRLAGSMKDKPPEMILPHTVASPIRMKEEEEEALSPECPELESVDSDRVSTEKESESESPVMQRVQPALSAGVEVCEEAQLEKEEKPLEDLHFMEKKCIQEGMHQLKTEVEPDSELQNESKDHPCSIRQHWAIDALQNLDALKELLLKNLFLGEESDYAYRRSSLENFSKSWRVSQSSSIHSDMQTPLEFPLHELSSSNVSGQTVFQDSSCESSYKSGTKLSFPVQDTEMGTNTTNSGTENSLNDFVPGERSGEVSSLKVSEERPKKENLQIQGAVEEGLEHFSDAQETHVETSSESIRVVVEEQEEEEETEKRTVIQPKVSGNFLILEGFEEIRESCTDDELLPSQVEECTPGSSTADCRNQTTAVEPGHYRRNPLFSQNSESEFYTVSQRMMFPSDFCSQILQYIQALHSDLQHLKDVEERYHYLCFKLAGSAELNEYIDKS